MTISKRDFNEQCVEFVRQCQKYSDTWTISQKSGLGQLVEVPEEGLDQIVGSDCELLLIKTEQRRTAERGQVLAYEFSVMFSDSYEVPVMYFCVSDQAGCPVSLRRMTRSRPEDLSKVINQVEHPLLFRPFYMIHPCGTENFMQVHHNHEKAGYLICWLSVVGTLIDLRLDSRLSRAASGKDPRQPRVEEHK